MKKINFSRKLVILLISFLMIRVLISQTMIPADPYKLYYIEKNIFLNNNNLGTLLFRPLLRPVESKNIWSITMRSELFFNSNAPNLENMSDRWVGKGFGQFSSVNLTFINQYFIISAEPYYFIDQNADYKEPDRLPKFSRLNDNRPHLEMPYTTYGIRELQIYAKYRGIGVGYSNANMWWGSGIQSSIMMTNNTSGFGHVFLGTIEEKRYKKIGINTRYIFSKFDKKSLYQPYFSAIVLGLSYYSDNVYTIGVSKSALTGGIGPGADDVTWQEAARAVFFSGIKPRGQSRSETIKLWSHDDHAGAGYVTVDIKKSFLKLFFEVGLNDRKGTRRETITQIDNKIAINIGMRKYNFLKHEQLFFGFEYINLQKPRLTSGDWYERNTYDSNSYNGRRWVAHSGSDSDDLLLILGWLGENLTIIPSFNYERHGLRQPTSQAEPILITDQLNDIWPETKLEFRLDLRYKYKDYKINFYIEREVTLNLESRDKTRKSNVFWVGIERNIGK